MAVSDGGRHRVNQMEFPLICYTSTRRRRQGPTNTNQLNSITPQGEREGDGETMAQDDEMGAVVVLSYTSVPCGGEKSLIKSSELHTTSVLIFF